MIGADSEGFIHRYTAHKDDVDFTAYRVTTYPNHIAVHIPTDVGNQFTVEEIREIASALNELAANVKAYDNEHYAPRREDRV
jgi:hypothetical protein